MKQFRKGQRVIYNGEQYSSLKGTVGKVTGFTYDDTPIINLGPHKYHTCSEEFLIPILFTNYYEALSKKRR